jgi:hypothetical protein
MATSARLAAWLAAKRIQNNPKKAYTHDLAFLLCVNIDEGNGSGISK